MNDPPRSHQEPFSWRKHRGVFVVFSFTETIPNPLP